jgi:uncharacterized membrane protein
MREGVRMSAQRTSKNPWQTRMVPARGRIAASALVGVAVGATLAFFTGWEIAVLSGWCIAAVTFVAAAWIVMFPADAARTREIAMRIDETRLAADIMVLSASVASLIGVAFILLKASSRHGAAVAFFTGLGVASVLLGWSVVHTVYTLRYADLYYALDGGIDFNGAEDPDYRDFAYLAFTIGMTYQVSDTALQKKAIRRMAFGHALLSFVFGTTVIAMTINVVASLAH